MEFFTYGPNNAKIPVNDRTNPNAIKAYYNANTGPPRPQITVIRLDPNNMIHIEWINGGTLEVADEVTGTWTDTGLSSPVVAPIDRIKRFGRVKR